MLPKEIREQVDRAERDCNRAEFDRAVRMRERAELLMKLERFKGRAERDGMMNTEALENRKLMQKLLKFMPKMSDSCQMSFIMAYGGNPYDSIDDVVFNLPKFKLIPAVEQLGRIIENMDSEEFLKLTSHFD